MPQPFSSVSPQGVDYRDGLPYHNQTLCILAMSIVASWSRVDGCTSNLISIIFPGRARQLIEYYNTQTAKSPKTSMLYALMTAVLSDEEYNIFAALMKLYSRSYKARNPFAHHIFGHSPSFPNILILTDPREFFHREARRQDIFHRVASGESILQSEYDKESSGLRDAIRHSQTYNQAELQQILNQMQETYDLFWDFQFYLNWRVANVQREELPRMRSELARKLGLPEPTAI